MCKQASSLRILILFQQFLKICVACQNFLTSLSSVDRFICTMTLLRNQLHSKILKKKKDAKNHKLILTNTKFRHISIHIFLCIKNFSKNYNGCKLYEEDKSLGNFGMMNEMYTDRYKREFQTKLGDAEAMHSSLYRSKQWLNWIAIPIFSGTNGFKSIYFVLKIQYLC